MTNPIKLLVSDMDGTVLSGKQRIEPETIQAIEATRARCRICNRNRT
ncbi:HAD hydrolase family protein [Exiguobacterium sp. SL14]|nr:HAD hydrolase family protein [Exiguobacterium sp. SL14]MCY1692063.1 HAD hydrolase family protein [Exiguobacterium sp. SL14]